MGWARASSLTRALNCPASVWDRSFVPERPSGPAAEWGHTVHRWKATGELPEHPTERRWFFQHDLFWPRTELWPGGTHEVGLALKVGRTRIEAAWMGPEADRWDLGPDWVTGAGDWVSDEGILPQVDDLKTGKEIEPPPTDQTLLYSDAYARVLKTDSDVLNSITHWTRYPLGKGPVRSTALVVVDERREFEERLVRAKARADARDPANPGPWCKYCPHVTCEWWPYHNEQQVEPISAEAA